MACASAAKALTSCSLCLRLPSRLRRLQALVVRRRCQKNVVRVWFDSGHPSQRCEVASARTTPSTGLQVLLREERRHLFRQCSRDQLINRYSLSSSQLPRALVKGIRKPKTQCTHDVAPMDRKNSEGVSILTPNRSDPTKSRVLNVTIRSQRPCTATSRTRSSLGSGNVGRHRK